MYYHLYAQQIFIWKKVEAASTLICNMEKVQIQLTYYRRLSGQNLHPQSECLEILTQWAGKITSVV